VKQIFFHSGYSLKAFNVEKQLRKEILLSEKLRALLLALVSLAVILVLLFVRIFFADYLSIYSLEIENLYVIQIVLFIFIMREVFVVNFIKNRLKEGKEISDRARYVTNFFEVSFISVILIILGINAESTEILLAPLVYLYFIIITLSTLSLEFKISASIGILAAFEYLIIFFILKEEFENVDNVIIYNNIVFHFGKAVLFIVGGVIAGLVAEQIKKKILKVNYALLERNKVINMFGQQISSTIVDVLLENDNEIKSQRNFVCIMFLDIRGFTPFAEKKEPEEIIKYQNNVFGFMIEIINKHNGIINQFLGDGYMATFGAPLSVGNDSQNAVNAALEIIEELKTKNENSEFPQTKIGIGLHSGFVVAGNVGTDIRKQYSISGNTVILASRIEQLNKKYNSQLLISKEVLDKVTIHDTEIKNHGEIKLKGREEPLEIYQLK